MCNQSVDRNYYTTMAQFFTTSNHKWYYKNNALPYYYFIKYVVMSWLYQSTYVVIFIF